MIQRSPLVSSDFINGVVISIVNSEFLSKVLTANINYRDMLYFKEDCKQAYEELIPLQIKYFYEKT